MLKRKPEPPELMECPKCGYQWYSNSKLEKVCCPSCRRVSPREECLVKRGEDYGK